MDSFDRLWSWVHLVLTLCHLKVDGPHDLRDFGGCLEHSARSNLCCLGISYSAISLRWHCGLNASKAKKSFKTAKKGLKEGILRDL